MRLLVLTLVLPGLLAAPAAPVEEGAGPPSPAAGEPPPSPFRALEPATAYVEALDAASPPRTRRAASPAVDSVEDGPTRWRPHNAPAPAPQFVTKRGHEASPPYGARALPDDSASRFNEIPLPERGSAAAYTRYDPPGAYRSPDPYATSDSRARPATPRRVVYYADLPDVGRPRAQGPADAYSARAYSARDYDPYGQSAKYPRESRYDDRSPFSAYNRDDWYRYRNAPPSPTPNSYAIIDAERSPQPSARGPYVPARPYPDQDPALRYNRVPAPYQQRNAGTGAQLAPAQGSPYDQYRRPPPGGAARLSVGGGPNRFGEPYRDYNPRQPAPWSMQIGTRLTVKDEDRNPYGAGRRFYVQSQDQGQYAAPPTRFSRVEDDPRHRL